MGATAAHRKLIDIKPAVFESLSLEAARNGVSLKRYIEETLEKACRRPEIKRESGIGRLIGSALPKNVDIYTIDDDRLQYLLSK